MAIRLKNNTRIRGVREIARDVIEDILLRLPTKSVIRFKSLSKLYGSIISHPRFSKINYTHRLTNSDTLFIHRVGDGVDPWKFNLVRLVGEKFETVAELGTPFGLPAFPLHCCNGIVLMGFRDPRRGLALWNPSIRRHTMILSPPGMISWSEVSEFWIYQDSRRDDYKVVITTEKYYQIYSCKTSAWEEESRTPLSLPGVCNDGCLYAWCGNKKIVYFDFQEREFGELESPDMRSDPTDLVSLGTLKGQLCVYCTSRDESKFEFRVMQKEEKGNLSGWTELNSMEKTSQFSLTRRADDDDVLVSTSCFMIYDHLQHRFQQTLTFSGVNAVDLFQCADSLCFPPL